jgi:hypothetical protein
MEEGKEPAVAAGDKQAGSNITFNLLRAFTLLMEERSTLAFTLGSTCSGLSLC